jgi:membrane protease YdiL (CAAX protease family)
MTLLGILIMMGISLHLNVVKWDPKIPVIAVIWMIDNLIFVSIPEEAFFRGFIQRELYHRFGKNAFGSIASIFVTSLFFTLIHLIWVADLPFLCLVFIASIIFGTIYQVTESIEASIFCHYALNVTQFFLFTYPALQA